MNRRTLHLLAIVLVLLSIIAPSWLTVIAQNASLDDQLRAQYQLVKMSKDSNGQAVTQQGTVLKVLKGGIPSVPPDGSPCRVTYANGSLGKPGASCNLKRDLLRGGGVPWPGGMHWPGGPKSSASESRDLSTGEKVYPAKIEVHPDKGQVILQIVECDSCNGATQPSSYKAEVVFQFAAGSLDGGSVNQVVDTINQVLAFDENSDTSQQAGANSSQSAQNAPVDQASAQPQTIHLGQSIDEVVAVFGQPEKILSLGDKQIYVYKDVKITFVNSKVSDMQ